MPAEYVTGTELSEEGFITDYTVTKGDVTQHSYSHTDLGLTAYSNANAVAAIKSDGDWNATAWDAAASWHTLMTTADGDDSIVDTVNEMITLFDSTAESLDLMTALNAKADSATLADYVTTATLTANYITAELIETDYLTAAQITADYITTDTLVASYIDADSATIGGWDLDANSLSSGSVVLDAGNERLKLGAIIDFALAGTAAGILIGKDGSDYELLVGKEDGNYLHWDGSTLHVKGTIDDGSTVGGKSLADIKATSDLFTKDDNGVFGLNDSIKIGDKSLGEIKTEAVESTAKIKGIKPESIQDGKFIANLSLQANFIFDCSGEYTLQTLNEADNIGQSGTIVLKNVAAALPGTLPTNWKTPNGDSIAWNKVSGTISIISYFVVDADTVLVNYVGNFE